MSGPMDAERLARLKHEASLMRVSMIPESVLSVAQLIGQLIADRDWHRARVEVTAEDIAHAGITVEQAQAWLRSHDWVEDGRDRFTEPGGRGNMTTVRYDPVMPITIRVIAGSTAHSQFEVIDEIAAMEVESDG